jgi:hypothetical protein
MQDIKIRFPINIGNKGLDLRGKEVHVGTTFKAATDCFENRTNI